MSNDTEARTEGVLVADPDGTVGWWSERVAAVAAVPVTVGEGVQFEVDAADPTTVLAWAVAPGGDISALAAVFGDQGLPQRVAAARAADGRPVLEPAPAVTTAWVRLATVAAVRQCTVRPLHEGALLLDLAGATRAVGNAEVAAHVFALAAPSLLALGELCLTGEIRGGAATEIVSIAQVAASALVDTGWAADVFALASRLQDEVSPISDEAIAAVLSASDTRAPAFIAGSRGNAAGPSAMQTAYVDPALVPPRILLWPGADRQEILVEVHDGFVVVSAELADQVDDRTLEANRFLAYAARSDDGDLVATAPMTVVGRSVSAALPVDAADIAGLSFGVFHAESDLEDLRADRAGAVMVEVDRQMADAFGHHRSALAALHTTAVGDDQLAARRVSKRASAAAKSAASRAVSKLERFAQRGGEADVVNLFTDRAAVVQRYRQLLDELAPAAGTEPLLCELLPADLDE